MRRLLVLAVLVPGVSLAAAERAHHWAYEGAEGPSHWGGACAAGKAQSPVDIRSASARHAVLPALEFHYRPGALHVVDNGHAIQVRVPAGSSMTVGGERFELVQFHFHEPGEESVDGRRSEMDVHLVHKDAAGRLAVVAVPFGVGADNKAVAEIAGHLPAKEGREESPAGERLDPSALLPADRAYFTYWGSLTTPPCTEGVRWFVLRSPQSITAPELGTFAKVHHGNARPVQPLNGRSVATS
ncbi:MAG: carbonic anhydrase family protein [Alphaproteobacteria bacterium]|nr:MAG: carbonic anhydrase family protein [Alphaproteobacteria bacterium]